MHLNRTDIYGLTFICWGFIQA